MDFVSLFGEQLVSKDGRVKTTDALAGKKAVGVYFSAHWCPPCRGFTPKLAEAYTKMKAAGLPFEIVFVSSDRDEAAFSSYHSEQPWLALPFANRRAKDALSRRFDVGGIPTLVILDERGAVITKEGRAAVMQDPSGAQFPWHPAPPPSTWEALGHEFLRADGESVELDELRGDGKILGLYFSAHWCPPCRSFTPALVKAYEGLKADGKPIEIIFVSSDRDGAAFREYFSSMPWLAIPHDDPRKRKLADRFSVDGIPALVFIDAASGDTLSTEGRRLVGTDPKLKALFAKAAARSELDAKGRKPSFVARLFRRTGSSAKEGAAAAASA